MAMRTFAVTGAAKLLNLEDAAPEDHAPNRRHGVPASAELRRASLAPTSTGARGGTHRKLLGHGS
jgi:hypothetical protein